MLVELGRLEVADISGEVSFVAGELVGSAGVGDVIGAVPLDAIPLPETGALSLELLSGYGALDPVESTVGMVPETPLGVMVKGADVLLFKLAGDDDRMTVVICVSVLRVEVVYVPVAVEVDVWVNTSVDEEPAPVPVPELVSKEDILPVDPSPVKLEFDSGYGAEL
jgi:hypothetical protein